jgi:hypothetical protein
MSAPRQISSRKKQTRTLHFICVTDPHSYAFVDEGNYLPPGAQAMVETTGRDRMRDMLRAVHYEEDGAMVPMWALAAEPDAVFVDQVRDDFDSLLRDRSTGKWAVATPEWLAIRKRHVDEYAAAIEERHARKMKVASSAVAEQLTGMVAALAQHSAQAVPAAAPSKGGKS